MVFELVAKDTGLIAWKIREREARSGCNHPRQHVPPHHTEIIDNAALMCDRLYVAFIETWTYGVSWEVHQTARYGY